MRAGAEISHRTKIPFFGRSEPVKTYSKEALIKGCDGFIGCIDDVFSANGTGRSNVPGSLAPFLQEIRVSFGFFNDEINCRVFNLSTLFLCRAYDRLPGFIGTERTNRRKIEHPFRVGFCVAEERPQLRQTRPNQDHRELFLNATMQSCDKGGGLTFFDVLKLIHEKNNRRICRLRSDTELKQELTQIIFKIAVVGKAWFRVVVEAYFKIAVGELQCLCETGKRPQASNGIVFCSGDFAEMKKSQA